MIKKTLIYMPAILFPRAAAFVVAFIGSHFLAPREFGYFSLTIIIGELSDNIIANWARIGMARFGVQAEGIARGFAMQMGQLLAAATLIAVCASVVIAEVLAPERLLEVAFTAGCYIVSMAAIRYGARLLQISQHHRLASTIDSVRAILFVAATSSIMWLSPNSFVKVSLAGSAINATVGVFSCIVGVSYTRRDMISTFPLRHLISFAAPIVVVSILTQFVTNLDKVLMKSIYNATQLGRYALAFSVGRTAFDVLGAAFNTWAFVSLSGFINEGKHHKARHMLGDQLTMFLSTFLPMSAIICASVDLVALTLFRPDLYSVFVSATPIVVFGAFMYNLKVYVYDNVFFLYLRNVLQIISLAAGATASVFVGLWVVPHDPSRGGALVFASGAFVSLIVSIVLSRRYLVIPFNWKALIISASVSTMAYFSILIIKAVFLPVVSRYAVLMIVGVFSVTLLASSTALANALRGRKPPRLGGEASRYALLANQLNHGGLERVVVAIANGIVSKGIPITLILRRNHGVYGRDLDPRVRIIELGHSSMMLCVPKLFLTLWRERFDVVLSGGDQQNLALATINLFLGRETRFVITEHSNPIATDRAVKTTRTRWARKARRFLYPRLPKIVAVSDGSKRALVEQFGCDPARVKRIYNPVAVAQIVELAQEPVDHPWFNGEVPLIVAVGRLHVAKGFDDLLNAFAVLRSRRHVRLLLIGDGPERAMLEEQSRALGVDRDIDMPGFKLNPYAYMARGQVFVLSSRWEGFALVVAEALASGAKVVATDCPDGPREILDGGRFGALVPVSDTEALADAIEAALDQDGDAQSGRERAMYFAPDIAINEYLKVFQND